MNYESTRTDAYIGTFGMDQASQDELKSIRRMVTHLNKDLKKQGYSERYYVKAQGRGHRMGKRQYWQSLPLQFAQRVDAYIYKR